MTSEHHQQCFAAIKQTFQEIALLQTAADTLEWDERTGLPSKAGDYRASQVTHLRGIVHERRTSPEVGQQLQELAASPLAVDLTSDVGATISRLNEDFERERKLPKSLVEALARATVIGQQKWDAARKADDYAAFQPALSEILQLKRDAAAHQQTDGQTLYDAMLHEFEPGAKASELTQVFADLRTELVSIVQAIQGAPQQPDTSILRRSYPVEAQRSFSRFAAAAIGFDFDRGRLDVTSHPFCTSLGPDDSRILTRYDEHWFPGGLFGTLHEAGHGMYDQGLRSEWYGLPPGSFVSLGIHESQSRLWENLVGRSRAFWEFAFPHAQSAFASTLSDITLDQMHFAVNGVTPSLIRVEADEATYNLHIIIRFELEQQLVEGSLSVDDLPDAWNERYRDVLGIEAPSAADGVLQDVHWSAGLFGYFPTYTIGNLCAAQLYDAAKRDLGDIDAGLAAGDASGLLTWLQQHVHGHGRNFTPNQLVENATGKPIGSEALIASLKDRYQPLYGL